MTLVIVNVASVEFLRSVVEGLVIIQLPTIAADINLDRGLLLWSVFLFFLICLYICFCHCSKVARST